MSTGTPPAFKGRSKKVGYDQEGGKEGVINGSRAERGMHWVRRRPGEHFEVIETVNAHIRAAYGRRDRTLVQLYMRSDTKRGGGGVGREQWRVRVGLRAADGGGESGHRG